MEPLKGKQVCFFEERYTIEEAIDLFKRNNGYDDEDVAFTIPPNNHVSWNAYLRPHRRKVANMTDEEIEEATRKKFGSRIYKPVSVSLIKALSRADIYFTS